jgi:hypothetical protein
VTKDVRGRISPEFALDRDWGSLAASSKALMPPIRKVVDAEPVCMLFVLAGISYSDGWNKRSNGVQWIIPRQSNTSLFKLIM